tara:strand:- start:1171 stop:1443 length:273 start_codon:yes stop_codon:yes gene_type:complete
MKVKDKPEADKIYALTAGEGKPSIANGNTWAQSEVMAEEQYKQENKCCLCDKEFEDFGDRNNAEPIQSGDCCKTCNDEQVIPARLKAMGY